MAIHFLPHVGAIQAHPAYARTYYFGSLLTEKYPHLQKQLSAAG